MCARAWYRMRNKESRWRIRIPELLLCALFLLTGCAAAGETEEAGIIYRENAMNFVEESMDISGGIPEDAHGVLARIRERGVLRVATEPYYPPQEFLDENKTGMDRFVGSDMEMARLIAERMGVDLEIVSLDFSEVLRAVSDGRADLAISALSYTPSRASSNELSKGYHFSANSAGFGLIVRQEEADKGELKNLSSFSDKILAAQSLSLQEALLAEEIEEYLEFRRYSTLQKVYDAVADGSVDAGAVDIETAEVYINTHPEAGLKILPDVRFQLPAEMDGDRIAGKKGEIQLLYFVNGVIDELLASGQYEIWFQAYQHYDGGQP